MHDDKRRQNAVQIAAKWRKLHPQRAERITQAFYTAECKKLEGDGIPALNDVRKELTEPIPRQQAPKTKGGDGRPDESPEGSRSGKDRLAKPSGDESNDGWEEIRPKEEFLIAGDLKGNL